jgi:hypothetical protein
MPSDGVSTPSVLSGNQQLLAKKIEQTRMNFPHRQPGGEKPGELVINPVDQRLAFRHQLRLETAVPITQR